MTENYGMGRKRGPYGSNEGDIWTLPGSELQNFADARGEGHIMVMEVILKDGVLQDCVYSLPGDSTDPEIQALLARAAEGHERLIAARAASN